MMKIRLAAALVLMLALAVPLLGKTYKSTYPIACSELWPAVKVVLADAEHYDLKATDDAKMHADYEAKHTAHVTVTGVFTQRTNHVTLVTKGTGCEMQVVSNFSGWGTTTAAISRSASMKPWSSQKTRNPRKPPSPQNLRSPQNPPNRPSPPSPPPRRSSSQP